jgi:hypothetical protein
VIVRLLHVKAFMALDFCRFSGTYSSRSAVRLLRLDLTAEREEYDSS